MVIFPIPFHIFMSLVNLWLIRLHGKFPILRARCCPDLYLLIHPLKRPLVLGRGKILIPEFVQSPPTLAVYDTGHSLPQGGVGRGFPFTEDETRRHFSYLSGTSLEVNKYLSYLIPMSCRLIMASVVNVLADGNTSVLLQILLFLFLYNNSTFLTGCR